MTGLSPQQRTQRYAFDFQVVQAMNDGGANEKGEGVFHAEAYRSMADLEARRNPIIAVAEATQATKYRVDFRVPTLAGRNQSLQPVTTIGFDLAAGNYPYNPPSSWIIGAVPYSPHFRKGAPVCDGELWREAKGKMLFGQFLVYVAQLLNWDEKQRGGGYVGWNGDAIALHREKYGDRSISPGIRYPSLPSHLTHGVDPRAGLFGTAAPIAAATAGLFDAVEPAPRDLAGLFDGAGGR